MERRCRGRREAKWRPWTGLMRDAQGTGPGWKGSIPHRTEREGMPRATRTGPTWQVGRSQQDKHESVEIQVGGGAAGRRERPDSDTLGSVADSGTGRASAMGQGHGQEGIHRRTMSQGGEVVWDEDDTYVGGPRR